MVIAVADLATAAREIEARHGLTSLEGGRHPGWGTANRIVPLGDTYLELVAVVDEDEAVRSRFGSWVGTAHPGLVRPLGRAVRTEELDVVAVRLGLDIVPGSGSGDSPRRGHADHRAAARWPARPARRPARPRLRSAPDRRAPGRPAQTAVVIGATSGEIVLGTERPEPSAR